MTNRIRLTERLSYMLGLYECSRRSDASVSMSSKKNELVQGFTEIAVNDLGVEPNRIILEGDGVVTTVKFYNSTVRKLFEKTLHRKAIVFKYKNGYSASYIAALYDCSGGRDSHGTYMNGIGTDTIVMLERLGFHTVKRGARTYIRNGNDLITFIRNRSLSIGSTIS